jgi:hypothetical protein
MYISRLVKTTDPHPSLLDNCRSVSFHLTLIFSPLSLLQDLLILISGGSATMPSHTPKGPSVYKPSVCVHSEICVVSPHLLVQVRQCLAKCNTVHFATKIPTVEECL